MNQVEILQPILNTVFKLHTIYTHFEAQGKGANVLSRIKKNNFL